MLAHIHAHTVVVTMSVTAGPTMETLKSCTEGLFVWWLSACTVPAEMTMPPVNATCGHGRQCEEELAATSGQSHTASARLLYLTVWRADINEPRLFMVAVRRVWRHIPAHENVWRNLPEAASSSLEGAWV